MHEDCKFIKGPILNKVDPWLYDTLSYSEDVSSNRNTSAFYFPGILLSFVEGDKEVILHQRNSGRDSFNIIICIQLKGKSKITNNTSSISCERDEILIFNDNIDWCLECESSYSQIVLKFDVSLISSSILYQDIKFFDKVSANIGMGKILLSMIEQLKLEVEADHISDFSSVSVSKIIINNVIGCIQGMNNDISSSSVYSFHISRIKKFIAINLREPTLTLTSISTALDISIPHLHRIFKSEPSSISHYLWAKRLEGCANDLIDPTKIHYSISSIAYSWGFNDAAHFSRAFKEKYGCSPKQWRSKKQ
ncbi:helix-turn-helix domain-containing protein [Klebsiella michiganensis]|uniref:helix-turn-helix domain-containing protein n=1 Tax=Klebsiella TaxID=570 RepID=UPI000DE78AC9|nr:MULTISPECIES: helix-turn-helix domain-containing protein [Klebsiella]MEB6370939.1 helix-turn-helix domain-containing protein [Klebsiella michiganensis]UXO79605.1 helix-turn-helix domain-containing protein [Klebsiella michiganensis]SSG25518.1 transcriptional activator feaR [Klebsiella pneumoniae]HBZ7326260.1 helix-turn-helix domain-containing protein [Klebsiella pneumoniae]HBZ7351965.1 helix-turn-helix domain-containing protein [Klebsiella pneumoniae]